MTGYKKKGSKMLQFNEYIFEVYLNQFYREVSFESIEKEFKKYNYSVTDFTQKKGGSILRTCDPDLFQQKYKAFASMMQWENSYQFTAISEMQLVEQFKWEHKPTLIR